MAYKIPPLNMNIISHILSSLWKVLFYVSLFFWTLQEDNPMVVLLDSFHFLGNQKFLGSIDCFLAISLFLSFTRFLSVLTSCFWSSNNLFFCSTEILDILAGNKFSSFFLSRKLRESKRDNLEPFKIFASMVWSFTFMELWDSVNGEGVVSGFEIERWGLEKWHS